MMPIQVQRLHSEKYGMELRPRKAKKIEGKKNRARKKQKVDDVSGADKCTSTFLF